MIGVVPPRSAFAWPTLGCSHQLRCSRRCLFRAAFTATARTREPSWHRRARSQRSQARAIVTVARATLQAHHSAEPMARRFPPGGRARRYPQRGPAGGGAFGGASSFPSPVGGFPTAAGSRGGGLALPAGVAPPPSGGLAAPPPPDVLQPGLTQAWLSHISGMPPLPPPSTPHPDTVAAGRTPQRQPYPPRRPGELQPWQCPCGRRHPMGALECPCGVRWFVGDRAIWGRNRPRADSSEPLVLPWLRPPADPSDPIDRSASRGQEVIPTQGDRGQPGARQSHQGPPALAGRLAALTTRAVKSGGPHPLRSHLGALGIRLPRPLQNLRPRSGMPLLGRAPPPLAFSFCVSSLQCP